MVLKVPSNNYFFTYTRGKRASFSPYLFLRCQKMNRLRMTKALSRGKTELFLKQGRISTESRATLLQGTYEGGPTRKILGGVKKGQEQETTIRVQKIRKAKGLILREKHP